MEKFLKGNLGIDFDFHIHTIPGSRDSKQTVLEMLQTAKNAGITTVAITDHNNVSSLKEEISLAKTMDMTLIPGVEMSVFLTNIDNGTAEGKCLNGEIVHIIGLGIKPDENLYKELSADYRARVKLWMKNIIQCAENHFKYKSKAENVWQLREELCTLNFSASIKDAKELIQTFNDGAVEKLIPFNSAEALEIIHKMGGIAILAHPNRGECHRHFSPNEVQKIIEYFVPLGLDGLEIYHKHVVKEEDTFVLLNQLCQKYQLVKSLGGDRHAAYDAYGENYFEHREFLENLVQTHKEDFYAVKEQLLEKIDLIQRQQNQIKSDF